MNAFWSKVGNGLNRFFAFVTGPRMQLIALLGGGVAVSGYVVWVTFMVRHGWNPEHQGKQLDILSWALMSGMALIGLVFAAAAAGLITGIKLKGPAGVEFGVDLNDPDDDPSPVVNQERTNAPISERPVSGDKG